MAEPVVRRYVQTRKVTDPHRDAHILFLTTWKARDFLIDGDAWYVQWHGTYLTPTQKDLRGLDEEYGAFTTREAAIKYALRLDSIPESALGAVVREPRKDKTENDEPRPATTKHVTRRVSSVPATKRAKNRPAST